MSYRIPKLGDDGKVAAEHIPDPAAIGAATPADLSSGLATKVNTSTYTAGLAGKQDVASLASDVASHVADGSALATALGAALGRLYAPLGAFARGNRWVPIGDSITAGYNGVTSDEMWVDHAAIRSGGRLFMVANGGISGNTSADVLARLDALIASTGFDVATLMIGTNDASQSVPLATYQANVTAIVQKLRDAGITPVLMTCPPKNGSPNLVAKYNTWLSYFARNHALMLIDVHALLTDPSTDGNFLASMNGGDGVHPSQLGHYTIGNAVASTLTPLLPATVPFLIHNDADPNNLVTNAMFYTDANADGQGDSWTFSGGGTPASISIVTDSRFLGKAQKVSWNANSGGTKTFEQQVTMSGKYAVGDRLLFGCRVAMDNVSGIPESGSTNGLSVSITFNGAGQTIYLCRALKRSLTNGILAREIVVPAATTSLKMTVLTAASASGVVDFLFGQATVRNLTAMGVA